MNNKALLVIDMLNDFVEEGAPMEVAGARNIIPNIQRELDKAHKENMPTFYLCDSHSRDDPELRVWPPHAIQGTRGANIVEPLAPAEEDTVIPKTRYDGFFGTDLDEQLKSKSINELILTGVTTEICIQYTGASAIMRGYPVDVPEDCVKGLDPDLADMSIKMVKDMLQ